MSYVDNLNETDDEVFSSINHSLVLNTLAKEIVSDYLKDACDVYIPRETKSKARTIDLVSGIAGAFKLIKMADGKPVYLVQEHYSWEYANGFYFFIGTHDQIEQKLLELSKNSHMLKKNRYSY